MKNILQQLDLNKADILELGFTEEEIEKASNLFQIRTGFYSGKRRITSKKIENEVNYKTLVIPNYFHETNLIGVEIEGIDYFFNYYYPEEDKPKYFYDPLGTLDKIQANKPTFILNTAIDYIVFYMLKEQSEALADANFITLYDYEYLLRKLKALPKEVREQYNFIFLTGHNEERYTKAKELSKKLEDLNIYNYLPDFQIYFLYDSIKTYFNNDREELLKLIEDLAQNYKSLKEQSDFNRIRESREKYSNTFNITNQLNIFRKKVDNNEIDKVIAETPFNLLNDALGGGIKKGLITCGAVSSLGKSTFILQIANHIAKTTDNDILFFSLEMSKSDLITKSISNESFLLNLEKGKEEYKSHIEALNRKDIASKEQQDYLREHNIDRIELLEETYKKYQTFSDRLFILDREDLTKPTISSIINQIERHIEEAGKKPIIIIDYLQIIRPDKDQEKLSEKQQLDFIVDNLMELSHKKELAIIVISSYGRQNYYRESDISSGKGSGNIEYSSDIIIGLDYYCLVHRSEQDIKEGSNEAKNERAIRQLVKNAKNENPRKVALTILKNRYGKSQTEIDFNYYPDKDTFIEDAITTQKNNNDNEEL